MADRLPTVDEIIRDRSLVDKLPILQLHKLVERLRQEARGFGKQTKETPAAFAHRISGGIWVPARHLEYLSKRLQAAEQRKVKRIMVSMPPRYGKSRLINVYFPLYWLTRNPFDRVVLAAYGETFARRFGAEVRDLVLEHGEELNLYINRDSTAADDWDLTRGGGMLCVGVGGALMGRGANLLIIDDPIKNDIEANSQTYRDRMWDWWEATASTRIEPGGAVVIVATRWHEDDLLGRMERNHGSEWEIIKIPAIAEENDPLGRYVGETLWPERFPVGTDESPEKIQERLSPYWFSAMYQQHPSPPGGGLLTRDDWQFQHKPTELKFDQMIQSWDLAMKDKQTSDFSVGQVWGRKGADLYLVDQIRGHLDLAAIESAMKSFTIRFPQAVAKLVEDTALGPALKQRLQHEVPGIMPIPVKGTTKRSRAEGIVPFLKGHNIYLPENLNGSKERWVWDFIEECAQFPRGTYDDQVDAMGHAVAFLQPTVWSDMREKAKEAAEQDPGNIMTPKEVRTSWFNGQLQKAKERFARKHNPRPRNRFSGMW